MDVHLLATSAASRFCINHANHSITSIYSRNNEIVVLEHLSSDSKKCFSCEMTPDEAGQNAKALALHAAYAEIGFAPDQDNKSVVETLVSQNRISNHNGDVVFSHAYTGNHPADRTPDLEMKLRLSPPGAVKIGEGLAAVSTQILFLRMVSDRAADLH